MSDEKWYKDGLRFQCTQCGNCCSGPEGYVWVNDEELVQIAGFLGKPLDEVKTEHARRVGNRVSLKEFANGDCTFLHTKERRCTIYPVRPQQCRTWPFWNSNISSPRAWKGVEHVCPGAGHGQLYTLEQIETQAAVIPL
ncbi:MAG: YkgJ family cysteine cluster protein [Planctomycetia bacterium]|nr:YkgJ family cysteine cluster protein [Planctomycetia bacterium]